MNRSLTSQHLACVLALLFSAPLLPGQAMPPGTPSQNVAPPDAAARMPGHMRMVMAPPAETRTMTRLRPSTAEAGMARSAQPPLKALPGLNLVGRDNLPHGTAAAQHTGHWLLLYRTDPCVACDRLMKVLAASSSADLRKGVPYTVIVGSASPAALEKVRAGYDNLADANWMSDRDRKAFTALQLKGSPEVIAMDGSRIAWKVAGNLGDPQKVLRMTDSWIAGTAAADAAAKDTAAAKASAAANTVSTPAPQPAAKPTAQ